MTPRDGLPRFSPISVGRGDAGHRETSATPSESLGKPPFRSPLRPVGGRRKALTMSRIAPRLPSYPTGRMDDPYRSLSPFLGISPPHDLSTSMTLLSLSSPSPASTSFWKASAAALPVGVSWPSFLARRRP